MVPRRLLCFEDMFLVLLVSYEVLSLFGLVVQEQIFLVYLSTPKNSLPLDFGGPRLGFVRPGTP